MKTLSKYISGVDKNLRNLKCGVVYPIFNAFLCTMDDFQ